MVGGSQKGRKRETSTLMIGRMKWDIMKNWEGVGSVTTAFTLDKHLSEMGFGLAHCWMNVRWEILLRIAKQVWNWIKSRGLHCSSDLIFYDRWSKLSIYCKSRVWYESCNCEKSIVMNLLAWETVSKKTWSHSSPLGYSGSSVGMYHWS